MEERKEKKSSNGYYVIMAILAMIFLISLFLQQEVFAFEVATLMFAIDSYVAKSKFAKIFGILGLIFCAFQWGALA